jgi:hypothetical protein
VIHQDAHCCICASHTEEERCGNALFIEIYNTVFDLAGMGIPYIESGERSVQLADPLGIAKIYVAANNPTSPLISPYMAT